MGTVYHRLDDAFGAGDGVGDEGGGRGKDGMGDGVGGVGAGRMCLGGKVGGGDTDFGKDVHVGSADVSVVDHGIWADGEHSPDLAVAGTAGLSELLFKNRNGSGVGGSSCDFGSAAADACINALH